MGPCPVSLLPLPPLAAGRRSLANAPPARPFPLRDILYNNPSESKRKRRALPGPVPQRERDQMLASPAHSPYTRHRGARLPGGGRARAPTSLVPPRRRRCRGRSPSRSSERHQLRQLLQTHLWSPSSQGAGCSLGGASTAVGGKPSGEEKVPRGPPLARTAPRPAAPPARTRVRLGNL